MRGLFAISNSNLGAGMGIPENVPSFIDWMEKNPQVSTIIQPSGTESREVAVARLSYEGIVNAYNSMVKEYNDLNAPGAVTDRAGVENIRDLRVRLEEWKGKIDVAQKDYEAAAKKYSAAEAVNINKAKMGTDAEAAEAFRKSTEEYRKFYAGVSGPGYDVGMGSARRNMLFAGDRGLSGLDGWWIDLEPQNRALMGAAVLVAAIIILGTSGYGNSRRSHGRSSLYRGRK
jgi:hypothetical protein